MRTDVKKINETTPHQDLTEGLMMFAAGTSKEFNTGRVEDHDSGVRCG